MSAMTEVYIKRGLGYQWLSDRYNTLLCEGTFTWITKFGTLHKIKDMSDSHIQNALKYLITRGISFLPEETKFWINVFKFEHEKRNLKEL